eukprot:Gregarina_sp_Poly_1__7488@NODE_4176_length_700_cov_59_353870_g2748_i0_p1_GENE_NODE_4176_length_700_cov_59_353870_g2748_i0NODE_4176_length_700_cov_59_353870_g2748_i0_p1_ORF_typecomplete_len168_score19_65_NODE_4176_length_700_cov_59_353870_g2748_i060563
MKVFALLALSAATWELASDNECECAVDSSRTDEVTGLQICLVRVPPHCYEANQGESSSEPLDSHDGDNDESHRKKVIAWGVVSACLGAAILMFIGLNWASLIELSKSFLSPKLVPDTNADAIYRSDSLNLSALSASYSPSLDDDEFDHHDSNRHYKRDSIQYTDDFR